ncbi:MAG: hypothetical protein GX986_04320 [Firmicutes bacterium]|nr:hypothetical protein [Bacillota bacterium]
MSQKEKELKRLVDEYGYHPLDVEDGVQLPNMMGWIGGLDFKMHRAKVLEEIAAELGADRGDKPIGKNSE